VSEPTAGQPSRRQNYALHLALFLATCVTTTWAGTLYAHGEIGCTDFGRLATSAGDGLYFSLSIMAILLTHEMGHYFMARRRGIPASLPYFLPVPLPMVGTMGAVIVVKGTSSRKHLLDFAAAGPLAGLVVAIPVLAYGIHLSEVKPIGPGYLEGNSILYLSIKYLVKGAILPGGGMDVTLHPMAWAGWVGLLVTMINLMPIGQLDGGHISAAYFGERHNVLSGRLHWAMLPLALAASSYVIFDLSRKTDLLRAAALGWGGGFPWFIWWGLLLAMKRFFGRGRYHPPVEETPLDPGRRLLCVAMLIIFLLILVPIPMRVTL
jgi:membrane-associated protease RseP (regulator of RpoE activity)